MKVTMLLADSVQVAEGKLFVLGGGWNMTGPGPVAHGIALIFHVPWNDANRRLTIGLELVTADGRAVTQPGPLGETPVRVDGEFEVGRPVGVAPGSTIDVPLAINLPPLQLAPDTRFVWRLSINGQPDSENELPFSTRPVSGFGSLGATGTGPAGAPGPQLG